MPRPAATTNVTAQGHVVWERPNDFIQYCSTDFPACSSIKQARFV